MENYINGKLFDKNMKFCILVVNDLTNDMSYNAKLNFWGKIVKILWKIARNGEIFVLSIVVEIFV